MANVNSALVGTSGTPSSTNKYVTDADPRLTGLPSGGTATANTVFAGPTSGGAAAPAFRALVSADTLTRTAITGDTTLSATAPTEWADVTTIGGNITITLPAAVTGHMIIVTDGTNTAASNSSGYIVKIAPNGSETFTTPGGSAAGLYISEDGGSVVLEGLSGTGWRVLGGTGWGVDPRTISGLILWLDARRGLTLASNRLVSQWNDFSGNGSNVTQATTAQQPALSRLGSVQALFFNGAQRMSTGNLSITSGTVSCVSLFGMSNPSAAVTYQVIYGWNRGATSGNLLAVSTQTFNDWINYDFLHYGAGSNSAVAPRVIGYAGTTSGAAPATLGYNQPHVVASILGATASASDTWLDGYKLVSRVRSDAAVQNVTNQPIWIGDERSTTTSPLIGFIAETLIYSTALSSADRVLLEVDRLRQSGRGA